MSPGPRRTQERANSWIVRHVAVLKTAIRVIFGALWAAEGLLKFQPGGADSVAGMISDAGNGQPA